MVPARGELGFLAWDLFTFALFCRSRNGFFFLHCSAAARRGFFWLTCLPNFHSVMSRIFLHFVHGIGRRMLRNYCSALSFSGSLLPAGILFTTLFSGCPRGRHALGSPIRFVWTICSVGELVDCKIGGGTSGCGHPWRTERRTTWEGRIGDENNRNAWRNPLKLNNLTCISLFVTVTIARSRVGRRPVRIWTRRSADRETCPRRVGHFLLGWKSGQEWRL